MPAKQKKKTVKKTAAKKTAARKTTKKAAKNQSFLEKSFLHNEQEQFYKDHPNAKMLIAWFMLLFVVLGVIYLKKYLMV